MNSGPLDYKSSALTTKPCHCFPAGPILVISIQKQSLQVPHLSIIVRNTSVHLSGHTDLQLLTIYNDIIIFDSLLCRLFSKALSDILNSNAKGNMARHFPPASISVLLQ